MALAGRSAFDVWSMMGGRIDSHGRCAGAAGRAYAAASDMRPLLGCS